jgi:hypothetical protein
MKPRYYLMPDWLHSATTSATLFSVKSLRQGKPQTLIERFVLTATAYLLRVTNQAGVWGRL